VHSTYQDVEPRSTTIPINANARAHIVDRELERWEVVMSTQKSDVPVAQTELSHLRRGKDLNRLLNLLGLRRGQRESLLVAE
jgi:hypothetical protein